MELVRRHLQSQIEETLGWVRVVMLHGARQSGKTTLAQVIVAVRGGTYVSMDDEELRENVLSDPVTFLAHQRYPLVIDEAQRGGDRLVLAVKRLVDEESTPGRFILTGSTNFLAVPNISESLAGRVQIFRLWPLSEAELADAPATEIDRWFQGSPKPAPMSDVARADYLARVCRGGYPEAVNLDVNQRRRWFQGYVETVTQRDIVALADVRKAVALSPLLRWTAGLTGSEVNLSEASRKLNISRPTIISYFEWLQTVFLIHALPAWSRSLSSSSARRPKYHVTDSALAAHLLGLDADALVAPTAPATGPLLETFVVNEIARQLSVSQWGCTLSHYRDHKGHEVDLVLEADNGKVVAVEVKATASPARSHMDNLRWMRDKVDSAKPGSFQAGILLHTGSHTVSVDDRLHMRPISSLWSGNQS